MSSPVQIPDLPSASVANDADFTVLRQGLTDYKCALSLLRNINVIGLTALPTPAANSDSMLISRLVASVPSNFKIPFSSVGLPYGTKTWFYMNSGQITSTLPGWQIVPNTGDTLISCAGGSTYNTAATTQGTWTQPTFKLDIGQIPAHSHYIGLSTTKGSSESYFVFADNLQRGTKSGFTKVVNTWNTGGNDSDREGNSDKDPDEAGHQPGNNSIQLDNTWRPFASVGNICQKLV